MQRPTQKEKVQGKFYPLQHEEWLKACKELTPSEFQVLYYLRTVDPYSNGFQITAAQIARDLSAPNKKVHRQTISRALKSLDTKGFIDLELIEVQVNINPRGYWCNTNTSMVCTDTTGTSPHQECEETPRAIATHHNGSPHTAMDHHTPSAIATHHPQPKTFENQQTQPSKTNKEYLDFLDSLLEDERESFLKFGEEKAAKLPNPPQLPETWIKKHYQEIVREWSKLKGNTLPSVQVAQNAKWENHPRRDEWLTEIESTSNPAMFAGSDKEKQAFVSWCWKTKQFSWLCIGG